MGSVDRRLIRTASGDRLHIKPDDAGDVTEVKERELDGVIGVEPSHPIHRTQIEQGLFAEEEIARRLTAFAKTVGERRAHHHRVVTDHERITVVQASPRKFVVAPLMG